MKKVSHFIIIDDDPINNFVCRQIISSTFDDVVIHEFTDPVKGIKYISDEYARAEQKNAVLLLDLNMPVMNGWEVLELFNGFRDEIKNRITIFICTSSVDQRDKDRAGQFKYVCGFIEKPLSGEVLKSLLQ